MSEMKTYEVLVRRILPEIKGVFDNYEHLLRECCEIPGDLELDLVELVKRNGNGELSDLEAYRIVDYMFNYSEVIKIYEEAIA